MTLANHQRYAIYFAPDPDSALGQFGNAWLGFRPDTAEHLKRPPVHGLSIREIEDITRAPSRYGFHATLKPPFRLAGRTNIHQMDEALEQFACDRASIALGTLQLTVIGSFLALVPAAGCPGLDRLAQDCVQTFDPYRASLSDAERERRRSPGMTQSQREYLEAWGYPYVFDEFRFHMTLTGPLAPEQIGRVKDALDPSGGPVFAQTAKITDICLFGDPGDGGHFRLLKRYALGPSTHPVPKGTG